MFFFIVFLFKFFFTVPRKENDLFVLGTLFVRVRQSYIGQVYQYSALDIAISRKLKKQITFPLLNNTTKPYMNSLIVSYFQNLVNSIRCGQLPQPRGEVYCRDLRVLKEFIKKEPLRKALQSLGEDFVFYSLSSSSTGALPSIT
jgi:hypothetical protein